MENQLTELFSNIFAIRVKIAECRELSRTAAQADDYERQLTEAQAQIDDLIMRGEK